MQEESMGLLGAPSFGVYTPIVAPRSPRAISGLTRSRWAPQVSCPMLAPILEDDAVRELVLPVSVGAYHRLFELGIIPEKTELLEGVIISKMPKSPRHSYAPEGYASVKRLSGPTRLTICNRELTINPAEF